MGAWHRNLVNLVVDADRCVDGFQREGADGGYHDMHVDPGGLTDSCVHRAWHLAIFLATLALLSMLSQKILHCLDGLRSAIFFAISSGADHWMILMVEIVVKPICKVLLSPSCCTGSTRATVQRLLIPCSETLHKGCRLMADSRSSALDASLNAGQLLL